MFVTPKTTGDRPCIYYSDRIIISSKFDLTMDVCLSVHSSINTYSQYIEPNLNLIKRKLCTFVYLDTHDTFPSLMQIVPDLDIGPLLYKGRLSDSRLCPILDFLYSFCKHIWNYFLLLVFVPSISVNFSTLLFFHK